MKLIFKTGWKFKWTIYAKLSLSKDGDGMIFKKCQPLSNGYFPKKCQVSHYPKVTDVPLYKCYFKWATRNQLEFIFSIHSSTSSKKTILEFNVKCASRWGKKLTRGIFSDTLRISFESVLRYILYMKRKCFKFNGYKKLDRVSFRDKYYK